MPIPITVPRLGWNMDEGTFAGWLKADGDAVRPGDRLFQLEGEKSAEEIESFDSGTLHIPADAPKAGDRVAVGAVLGWLLVDAETSPPRPPSPSGEGGVQGARVSDLPRGEGERSHARGEEQDAVGVEHPLLRSEREAGGVRLKKHISPRARRLAERHALDWTALRGSGVSGRIRERDVAAARPASDLLPHTAIRRTTAARMVESLRQTAAVTLFATADATGLVKLRSEVRASYTDFLLKLVAVALREHPTLAARWTDAGLRLAARLDIGLAVDTPAGLLVPVVRDVPSLSVGQIAEQTRGLIDRARSGKLTAAEMSGGCFTVSSLGAFGVQHFTPIINHPECAILGVGAIKRVPVMDGERVVGREQLPLSLTFDHRVVDGAPAARFLRTLCKRIEDPNPWV